MKLPSCTWLSRREFLKSFTAAFAVTGPADALAAVDALSSSAKAGATLPQRPLGKTGVQVSALALGGVIGMQLPPSADHDPMAIAETALNLGVTYFDVYKATTRLIIDKENPNVVSIQEVMAVDASGTDYYQTQYKIIESRIVAREVIRRLRLQENEEFSPKPKDTLLSNVKTFIAEIVTSSVESIASLFQREKASSEPSEQEEEGNKLISAFLERIDVSPIRNSRLVDVSFEAKDPVRAGKIVNTLAAAYIDQHLETKLKAVQDAVRWLQIRIEEERKKVEGGAGPSQI